MLIRHSMIYVAAKVLPGMMGMATTALLTRLLDPGQYGLYGLSLVVMTFGSTMVFDWLGVSFLRFYQARRGDPLVISTVTQIFLALVLGSMALTLLAWLGGAFAGRQAEAIAIGIVLMWAFSWFELISRFEIANFRPMQYFSMNMGRGLFILIGAGGAAWLTHDSVWTGIGTAAGTASGALLGRFRGWRLGRRHFDAPLARAVLSFGLPMAASMTLASLVNSGTRTLVEVLGSPTAMGLYTASFMLTQNTLSIVGGGISSASYSLAVRAVESGDTQEARRQLTANCDLLLAVLAPLALGMALTAHGIAITMVGARYVDSVTVLTPWMAAVAFFANMRAHYLDHAFQLGRRPSIQITVTAVAAVIALGLSVWLIPRLGPVGAAIAATVAMAVSCVHAWIAGKSAYPVPIPVGSARKVAAACLVMTAAVLSVRGDTTISFLARVAMGGVAYVAAAWALDVLGTRDATIRLIRRLRAR